MKKVKNGLISTLKCVSKFIGTKTFFEKKIGGTDFFFEKKGDGDFFTKKIRGTKTFFRLYRANSKLMRPPPRKINGWLTKKLCIFLYLIINEESLESLAARI